MPSVSLDYFYGIDAPEYATNSVNQNNQKLSNLGSSAVASLSLPIWNWGATQSRVKQAELRRNLAKIELSFAQRKLLSEMRSLYAEAETSLNELSDLQRSSELAADSLRLTTLRYKNGEATVLEVLDAENNLHWLMPLTTTVHCVIAWLSATCKLSPEFSQLHDLSDIQFVGLQVHAFSCASFVADVYRGPSRMFRA